MKTLEKLRDLPSYVRILEWMNTYSVIFFPTIVIAGLMGLISSEDGPMLASYMAFVFLAAMYGFVLNAYCDIEDDRLVGKEVHIDRYGKGFAKGFIVMIILMQAILLFLTGSWKVQAIGILVMLLATAYSARPVRLKERGLFGLVLLILTTIPLPFIGLHLLIGLPWNYLIAYMIFSILYSAVDEINHQYEDMERDKIAGVKNWAATRKDPDIVAGTIRFLTVILWVSPLAFFIVLPLWQAVMILPMLIISDAAIYRNSFFISRSKKLKSPTTLYVCSRCNNNCKDCFRKSYQNIEKIAKLKDIIRRDSNIYDRIIFSGREPTLNKDLPELIRTAKLEGFREIIIESNGRAFYYKDYVMKLADTGANSFVITIFGIRKEEHDAFTGVKGSFEQAMIGIRNILACDMKVSVRLYDSSGIRKISKKGLKDILSSQIIKNTAT